jgi:hypothetical protein
MKLVKKFPAFYETQILENTKEFSIETHHLLIDFRSAYDAIKREELYSAMS